MENIKEKFEFEVGSEYEGMRLDKYLSEQIEEATRSYLEKLIDNNYVKAVSYTHLPPALIFFSINTSFKFDISFFIFSFDKNFILSS